MGLISVPLGSPRANGANITVEDAAMAREAFLGAARAIGLTGLAACGADSALQKVSEACFSLFRKQASVAARPWSRCSTCRRCEYDDILFGQSWKCVCGSRVTQYRPPSQPRSRGQHGGRSRGDPAPAAPPADVSNPLEALLRPGAASSASSGPVPPELLAAMKVVEAHAQAAAERAAKPAKAPSPDAALRRASGECRDLHRRHQAAVDQVLRCRKALLLAENREKEVALLLAEAEAAKQKAAAAVAALGPVAGPASTTAPAATAPAASAESGDLFSLHWDDAVFDEGVLCELDPDEQATLAALRKELLAAKDLLQSHSSEVRVKLTAAKQLAAMGRQRMAKKRKSDADGAPAGQAAAESSAATPRVRFEDSPPAAGASAGASSSPDEASLAAAAAKLSQAKFAAAQQ
ncbi:unnamed protein product, partial [Prorocentrum cordatum]